MVQNAICAFVPFQTEQFEKNLQNATESQLPDAIQMCMMRIWNGSGATLMVSRTELAHQRALKRELVYYPRLQQHLPRSKK